MASNKFRILSIDGGGARGIYPAIILKKIQDEMGINFAEHFDIIVGTSTGAIIAAGLACDIELEKIIDLYRNESKNIFKNKIGLNRMFKSKYDSHCLKELLEKEFGSTKMKDITKTILLIPATNLKGGKPFVCKSPYKDEFIRDGEFFVKDVLLAASAAPTYFNPQKLINKSNKYFLADGGLWGNNPSIIGLVEALNKKRLNVKKEDISLLSIGTGTFDIDYSLKKKTWGLMNWGNKLVELVFSTQSISSENMVSLLLDEEQYFRVNFENKQKIPLDKYDENLECEASKSFDNDFKKIKKLLS